MSKHIHKFFLFVLVIGLPFSLTQCSSTSDDDDDDDDDNGGTTALEGLASCAPVEGSSVICGTVYAADGVTPVAGATLSLVESSGNISALRSLTADEDKCETDVLGAFACLVSDIEGDCILQISGGIFTNQEFTTECNTGDVTQVESALTTYDSEKNTDNEGTKWLVIPGLYDGIQLLLSQLKGCTLTGEEAFPESLTGSDECESVGLFVSDDPSTDLVEQDLSDFQAIFANCDADYSFVDGVTEALQEYVNNGGNMYFSDLADPWLTATFPNQVEFAGNSTSSGTLGDATVLDDGLAAFLGSSSDPQETMWIEFNLFVWTAIDAVMDEDWTTFIEGDLSDISSYTGTHPITVGGPKDEGCVFYTSYHVETGTSQGADQELALKYLILNRMSNCGEDTGGDNDACEIASCDSDSDCQQLAADDASYCGANQAGSPISDCMTCVESCCEVTE